MPAGQNEAGGHQKTQRLVGQDVDDQQHDEERYAQKDVAGGERTGFTGTHCTAPQAARDQGGRQDRYDYGHHAGKELRPDGFFIAHAKRQFGYPPPGKPTEKQEK